MAILQANVTIVGKRPILFNRFSLDSISGEKKEKKGSKGYNPDEWKQSVLVTEDGQLYVQDSQIFGCIRDGSKHIKEGRGSIQSKMIATLAVCSEIILIDRFLPPESELSDDKSKPVYLDVRSVVNPGTNGRNIRTRVAASPGWKATFKIEWEASVISRVQMEAAIRDAGTLAGLGDGRSIGLGRFELEKFVVENELKPSEPTKKKK